MKKLLAVGILALSASAFAYGGEHHYTRITGDDGRTVCVVRTSHRMGDRHRRMMRTMPEDLRISLERMKIEISQRRLNIEKLFLERPVNWAKVEEENKQIGIVQGQMKTLIQRYMMTDRKDIRPNVPPVKPVPKRIHHPEPVL